MLCAGLVHGDLSEYNVLVGSDGLVIIDLPQAMNAAGNNNAAGMLLRDVSNMAAYFGRFAPELLATDYGREIWKLYATGKLTPETKLTGRFEQSSKPADVHGVMRDVDSARRWHERNI
jgi:RIO kinase 1